MLSSPNFLITAGVLLASVGLIGYLSVLERRPRQRLEPRLIPTAPAIIILGFVALLAIVHIVNLYGIHTGRR